MQEGGGAPYRRTEHRRQSQGRSSWFPQDRSSLPPSGCCSAPGRWGTVGQCDQTSHRGLRGQSQPQQVELANLAHSTAVISHPHPHPVICQHEPGLARGLLGRSACPILSVRWAAQCYKGRGQGIVSGQVRGPSRPPCLPRGPRLLTAGPLGVVAPIDTDTLVGTEDGIGLKAGTLQVLFRHSAAVE